MEHNETCHDTRELNKFSLDSFFIDVINNDFDNVIDKLIKDLENEIKQLEKIDNNGIEDLEIFYIENELNSLSEMKIIYSFKHFETHLKLLLKGSYPKTDKSNLYKWDNLVGFLKTKKIKIKEIKNHKEINELRNLNNTIKHSNNILTNETKNILEFKGKEKITYRDILNFYERVKNSLGVFISDLSEQIKIDLYEFDENRIEKISHDICLRMDENTIDRLIIKLKEKRK